MFAKIHLVEPAPVIAQRSGFETSPNRSAGTTNRFPTTYTDPYTHQRIRKDLIPDALYGLEYVREDGLYYHFWAVEIDRGTVPKTSPNTQRKSLERQRLQYEDWIGNGKYRETVGDDVADGGGGSV